MSRRRVAAALVLAASVVLSACTTSNDPKNPDHDADGGHGAPAATAEWETTSPTVSEPVQASGSVVVYIHEGNDLILTAFDANDGRELWRRSATPSLTAPGLTPTVALRDVGGRETITFPERIKDEPLRADLTVLDAATGMTVHKVPGLFITSWPDVCADGEDICVRAKRDGSSETPTQWNRLHLDTGSLEPNSQAPDGSRFLDDDIVDLGTRNPEYIARVVDGTVAWKTPISDAYPAGSTSDNGWSFSTDANAEVVYGTIGGPVDRAANNIELIKRWDLSKGGFAAFHRNDGSVLWKATGYYACLKIDADPTIPDGLTLPIRCRVEGTASGRPGQLKYKNLDITIERFDLKTGETTWSVPLGEPPLRDSALIPYAHSGQHEVVVPTETGPTVIDLDTGESSSPNADDRFLCTEPTHYDFADPIYFDGTPVTRHSGGTAYFGCDADGQPAGAPDPALASEFGVSVGDVSVVATRTGLAAFTVG